MPRFHHRLNAANIGSLPAGRHADGGNNFYLDVRAAVGARKTPGRYFLYRCFRMVGCPGKVSDRGLG